MKAEDILFNNLTASEILYIMDWDGLEADIIQAMNNHLQDFCEFHNLPSLMIEKYNL